MTVIVFLNELLKHSIGLYSLAIMSCICCTRCIVYSYSIDGAKIVELGTWHYCANFITRQSSISMFMYTILLWHLCQ